MTTIDYNDPHSVANALRALVDPETIGLNVLEWDAIQQERVLRYALKRLDVVCKNNDERFLLHRLINRASRLGGIPTAPEVFGVDIVGPWLHADDES